MKILAKLAATSAVALALIQLVPNGHNHENPPISGSPQWNSPETEELARRACFDCHSHETRWPWYASIAPGSWRISHHIEEAREKLNFSAFDRPQKEAHEAAEEVEEGEMPPWDYLLLHPDARLNAVEKHLLIEGLQATFGDDSQDQSDHGRNRKRRHGKHSD